MSTEAGSSLGPPTIMKCTLDAGRRICPWEQLLSPSITLSDLIECFLNSCSKFSVSYPLLVSLACETALINSLTHSTDVFLWCNDMKFVEMMGYKPNKFVLIGDSSGGVNLLALAVVLCDLEKKYPHIPFIYPSGLVAVYPSFCVAPVALPSVLMAGLHPELSPPAFFAMQSAYFPYKNNQTRMKYEKMSMSRVVNWLTPGPVKSLLGVDESTRGDSKNDYIWWNKSFKHSMERMQNWPILRHPYASPLFYDDFERLSRMHLSLFPIESDPILDQAICLANKWQGSVSIKVIDNATHAFLPLAHAGALDAREKYAKHRDDISRSLVQLVQGDLK